MAGKSNINEEALLNFVNEMNAKYKAYQNPAENVPAEPVGTVLSGGHKGSNSPMLNYLSKNIPESLSMPMWGKNPTGHLRDLPVNVKTKDYIESSSDNVKNVKFNPLSRGNKTAFDLGLMENNIREIPEVGNNLKILMMKINNYYSNKSGGDLEPMYHTNDSGDSTMVTPFDALQILAPEYIGSGVKDKLNFFETGGKGWGLLNTLVPRKKRVK